MCASRFSEAQARKSELSLDYSFEASPELGLSEWKESERYDAVTCMFAVHYFFVAEKALKQVGECFWSCGAGSPIDLWPRPHRLPGGGVSKC